jgi:hypothetical protein
MCYSIEYLVFHTSNISMYLNWYVHSQMQKQGKGTKMLVHGHS